MKNLKALKEKRESLISELDVMLESLENTEGEVRSLTEEERQAFDAKKVEIDNIDATIKRVEERRAKELGQDEIDALEEKRTKEVDEVRALANFFRGHDLDAEERMVLASPSSNQALMPLEISKSIMQKLEEQCPILEKARRFSSKGTVRLIKEVSYGDAAVTPENTEFHNSDVEFGSIELRAYKVATQVQATFELLQNVEIDITNYLLEVIVRRLARYVNKLLLIGTGSNQPKGILKEGIDVNVGADLSINDFITMQVAMHPDYLSASVWIVNRATFSKMANLLDGTGRPYLLSQWDTTKNKIQYMFLGLPVIVDNNMPNLESGNVGIAMANIGEAYAVNVLTDITVRHLTEVGFTKGYETFAAYIALDGKTINPDAVVLGKVTPGRAAKASK